jgi:hypothetical protein
LIDNFVIDGGTGDGSGSNSDSLSLTGSTDTITSDTSLASSDVFDNIETLDLTNLTMNVGADSSDGGTNAEWTIDGDLIDAWSESKDITLNLDSDAANVLEFTDKTGQKYGGDDSDTTAIANGDYTLTNTNGDDILLHVTGL